MRPWADAGTKGWRRASRVAGLLNGDRHGNSMEGVAVPVRSWVDAVTESWGRAGRATELPNADRPGNSTAGAPGRCGLGPRCRHRKLRGCDPGHGAPECRPTREFNGELAGAGRSSAAMPAPKVGGCGGRAAELLNANRPGKFNGRCTGAVRPWADADTESWGARAVPRSS